MENLVSANVVIVARDLNPSIFSKLWLVREGIVREEDFLKNYIHSPMVTQVPTPDFQLLVLPEKLQIVLTDKSMDNSKPVIDKIIEIIQKLPHTPYTAIGTNFHWIVSHDTPEDFVGFMRNLFMKPGIPLYDEFSESNARFGAYMSKDIFGARLKLDIKPMRDEKNAQTPELLQFNFNYHLAVHGEHIDQMSGFLEKWKLMKDKSEEIVSIALSSIS